MSRLIKPDQIRQFFILALILILGGLIFFELLPYFSGVLGAITLYILFQRLMSKLINAGIRPWLGATIIMIISLFIIIIPTWIIVRLLSSKIQDAVQNSEKITTVIRDKLFDMETLAGIDVLSNINSQEVAAWVSENVQKLVGSTFNVFIALSIMYFILYYLLINTNKMKELLLRYMPLSQQNVTLISDEVSSIVSSNAIGIPVVAILQGIVALIGYYIFGAPDPLFWFVVTFIGSMIPFIGTALGIIPVTILLFANGQNWQAIGLLIYGIAVVGVTDNVFRVIIQNKLARLHPLITLIGVIIGVPLFGFIGLIFGPLLLSLFMLLIRIYSAEYGEIEGDET